MITFEILRIAEKYHKLRRITGYSKDYVFDDPATDDFEKIIENAEVFLSEKGLFPMYYQVLITEQ